MAVANNKSIKKKSKDFKESGMRKQKIKESKQRPTNLKN